MNFTTNEKMVLDLMVENAEAHDAIGLIENVRPDAISKRSFPGVVSSLVKKNIISCFEMEVHSNNPKTPWMVPTDAYQFTKIGADTVGFNLSHLEISIEELN